MRTGLNVVVLQSAAGAIGDGVAWELLAPGKEMFSRVGVQVAISNTATVTFEVSNDGTTYFAQDLALSSVIETPANVATASGFYVGAVCARYFRARISAWTSGTVTVTAVGV